MAKIPLTTYIAERNPLGAQALLSQWSLKANNDKGLVEGLDAIIKTGREDGYLAVASLHPDKKMILDIFKEATSSVAGLERLKQMNFEPALHSSKDRRFLEVVDGADGQQSKVYEVSISKIVFAAGVGLLLFALLKNI